MQEAICLNDVRNLANTHSDIDSDDWPAAYQITLYTCNRCTYEAKNTGYATWSNTALITVRTQKLVWQGDECVESDEYPADYYDKMDMMYTENSPWPYNDDSACAIKWTFKNDH